MLRALIGFRTQNYSYEMTTLVAKAVDSRRQDSVQVPAMNWTFVGNSQFHELPKLGDAMPPHSTVAPADAQSHLAIILAIAAGR